MARRKRSRRSRLTIGLVAVVIVLAAIWSGIWYAGSRVAAAAMADGESTAADRRPVTCENRSIGGYPLAFDLSCRRLTFVDGRSGLTAAVEGLAASTAIYRPGLVTASLAGPLRLSAPGLSGDAAWRQAEAQVELGPAGLKRTMELIEGLNLTIKATGVPIRALVLARGRTEIGPGAGADGTLKATGSLSGLKVERADGRSLPELAAEADVDLVGLGDALGPDPRTQIEDWLAKGGTIRIARLSLTSAQTSISTNGTLSVAPSGHLAGKVTLRLIGAAAIPDLAEAIAPGSRQRADQMAKMLAYMPAVATPDGPAHQVEITLSEGLAWLGVIPLPIAIPKVITAR